MSPPRVRPAWPPLRATGKPSSALPCRLLRSERPRARTASRRSPTTATRSISTRRPEARRHQARVWTRLEADGSPCLRADMVSGQDRQRPWLRRPPTALTDSGSRRGCSRGGVWARGLLARRRGRRHVQQYASLLHEVGRSARSFWQTRPRRGHDHRPRLLTNQSPRRTDRCRHIDARARQPGRELRHGLFGWQEGGFRRRSRSRSPRRCAPQSCSPRAHDRCGEKARTLSKRSPRPPAHYVRAALYVAFPFRPKGGDMTVSIWS